MSVNFINEYPSVKVYSELTLDYDNFVSTKDPIYADRVIEYFIPYVRDKVKAYYKGSTDDYDDIVQLILIDIYNELCESKYSFNTFKGFIIKGIYNRIFAQNELVLTGTRDTSRKIIRFMKLYEFIYGEFNFKDFDIEKVNIILEEMQNQYDYSDKVINKFINELYSWYSYDAFKNVNNVVYIEPIKSPEELFIEKDLPEIEEMTKLKGIEYLKYKVGYYGKPITNNKNIGKLLGVSQDHVRKQINTTQRVLKSNFNIIERHY